ncbi:FecCD family ABC transporter permease [Paracoccus saliphilus]|uniref:Iron ABC transporter permease n=1 Tax=Paracoccus saliphilus TaxID=405559 RepID=A0AA45W7H4_9RHOB|nr:iron ABC transporter permease [Paracoccus saliphilus]WCR02728.1 iron ABC transporter permease [Paracoccus saliphilus]SIT09161.1 iron complex transport system permease protein [Paracoccus saliphilus]
MSLQAELSPRPLRRLRLPVFELIALVALCFAMVGAVAIGDITVPPAEILKMLGNRIFGMDFAVDPIREGIVWHYRLSRAAMAASAGAALAVCGTVLQALLRNPLAEPYLLGISAGASTGAVLVMILGIGAGAVTLSGGAFLGAGLAFAFVAFLAHGSGGGTERIILAGIAGSQLFNAATSFIVITSANAEQTRGIMFWLLGSLGGVRWPDVALAMPVLATGLAICLYRARALDAFAFGEDAAASLGIDTVRIRAELFAITAMLTAGIVSLVGAVGFVGLVVPHASRFLVGPAHGRLIPATALAGGVFMVTADVLSRIVVPGQVLPIGVVTALFGAPAFAFILWRSRRRA